MKSLKSFIVESVKTYKYRLKIVGEVDQKLLQLIEINLQKFSIVHMGDPKSTPIQKSPYGFPGIENDRVTIIEVEFRYPVIEPFVKQMGRLLGLDENKVRLVTTDFDDSINSEAEGYANEADHTPLLLHTELEEQPGAKEAAKDYAGSYLDSIKKQAEGSKINMEYSAKTPPPAFDPFKQPVYDKAGLKSPMTTMIRAPRPETGARK